MLYNVFFFFANVIGKNVTLKNPERMSVWSVFCFKIDILYIYGQVSQLCILVLYLSDSAMGLVNNFMLITENEVHLYNILSFTKIIFVPRTLY